MKTTIGGVEAVVRYGSPEFTIVRPGAYVRCAVTGRHIPIAKLKYWSEELQEAYVDADAAFQRWREVCEANEDKSEET